MASNRNDEVRAFIALDIAPQTVQQIHHAILWLQAEIRRDCTQAPSGGNPANWIRWVPAGNMHLTLKFLGNASKAKIEDACRRLAGELEKISPFVLQPSGLGAFPKPVRPNVIWIGFERCAALDSIVSALEDGMGKLGFEKEEKPFRAHLTLGRVQRDLQPAESASLGRFIEKTIKTFPGIHRFNAFDVDAIHFYRSELNPDGPRYTRLGSINLMQNP